MKAWEYTLKTETHVHNSSVKQCQSREDKSKSPCLGLLSRQKFGNGKLCTNGRQYLQLQGEGFQLCYGLA